MNPGIEALWIERAREFRKWRGSILAASFQLEYIVDQVIEEYFFPGMTNAVPEDGAERDIFARGAVLKEIFKDMFLRDGRLTLGRKVAMVFELSQRLDRLARTMTDELKRDLSESLTSRNSFAHDPIYFRFVGGSVEGDLVPIRLHKGTETQLTSEMCAEARAQIFRACEGLDVLLKELRRDQTRLSADEGIQLSGTIWTFHKKLDSDDFETFEVGRAVDMGDLYLFATRGEMKLNVSVESNDEEPEESNMLDPPTKK